MKPVVAVVNQTSVLTDAQISPVVAALQKQVSQDFFPIWNQDAQLVQIFKGQTAPVDSWQIILLDTSDEAGALGYHDLTSDGKPLSKVFVKSCLVDGTSWSVDLSHELLEMLADPDINLCAQDITNQQLTLYAWEVCDPVQDDSCGYQIDGVLVSDFVTPAWFGHSLHGPWDKQNKLIQPFQLASGGYISINRNGSWSQIFGTNMKFQSRAKIGSRRERRSLDRSLWIKSS